MLLARIYEALPLQCPICHAVKVCLAKDSALAIIDKQSEIL